MEEELKQKIEDEFTKSEVVEEPRKVEYETDFVKKAMENKDKNLFTRVHKFRSSIQSIQNSYTGPAYNHMKKIEENDKKLKELFEGKTTFWTELQKTWYRLTGREYDEKEKAIDAMIMNASASVKNFDKMISDSQRIREELEQHYCERKELKVELSDRIDEYKWLIAELDNEISKYKRDYAKLEKEKEYKLRDALELEIDKMCKDYKNLNLEMQLASTEYIFVDNVTKTLDPLKDQIQTAIDNSILLKRQGELYIEEAEALKRVIVGFSKLVKYGVDLQKYMDKIGNSFNKGIGILSDNLELIIQEIGNREPKMFKNETRERITENNAKNNDFSRLIEQSRKDEIEDIRAQPGKYSEEMREN